MQKEYKIDDRLKPLLQMHFTLEYPMQMMSFRIANNLGMEEEYSNALTYVGRKFYPATCGYDIELALRGERSGFGFGADFRNHDSNYEFVLGIFKNLLLKSTILLKKVVIYLRAGGIKDIYFPNVLQKIIFEGTTERNSDKIIVKNCNLDWKTVVIKDEGIVFQNVGVIGCLSVLPYISRGVTDSWRGREIEIEAVDIFEFILDPIKKRIFDIENYPKLKIDTIQEAKIEILDHISEWAKLLFFFEQIMHAKKISIKIKIQPQEDRSSKIASLLELGFKNTEIKSHKSFIKILKVNS